MDEDNRTRKTGPVYTDMKDLDVVMEIWGNEKVMQYCGGTGTREGNNVPCGTTSPCRMDSARNWNWSSPEHRILPMN